MWKSLWVLGLAGWQQYRKWQRRRRLLRSILLGVGGALGVWAYWQWQKGQQRRPRPTSAEAPAEKPAPTGEAEGSSE